jgi:hypothetical protein
MDTSSEKLLTAKLMLDKPKELKAKHEGADRYKVFYQGRWRKVHVQVSRTFIVVNKVPLRIEIEGL